MGPQFHETMYGKRFFEKQLPELTKAINRLADAKEKENDAKTDVENLPVIKREAFDDALRFLVNNGIATEEAEDVAMGVCYVLLGDYRIEENS